MSDETMPENPQAFPIGHIKRNEWGVEWTETEPGMTLLDWFAGRATLEEIGLGDGWTVADCAMAIGVEKWNPDTDWPMLVAKKKYAYAYAMLRERERLIYAKPEVKP